jgi:hypothetical protein
MFHNLLFIPMLIGLVSIPTVANAVDQECLDSYPDNPEICDQTGDVNCTDLTAKDIKVTGTDPFDLDRDGNGMGCES